MPTSRTRRRSRRLTRPSVIQACKRHWPSVLWIVGGGVVAGLLATAKSFVESRFFQVAADAIEQGTVDDVLTTPMGSVASSDSGWQGDAADWAFGGLTVGWALLAYLGLLALTTGVAVLTATSRGTLTRATFVDLLSRGTQAAFVADDPREIDRSVDGRARPQEPGGLAGAVQLGAYSVANAWSLAISAVQHLVALASIVLLLANVGLRFVVLLFGLVVILALLSRAQAHALEARREKFDDQRRRLYSEVDDLLLNRDVLRAHERTTVSLGKLRGSATALGESDRALDRDESWFRGLGHLVTDAGLITLIVLVAWLASDGLGVSEIGDVYFYTSLYWRMLSPVRGLLQGYDDVRRSVSSSRTLIELLALASPDHDWGEAREVEPSTSAARFVDVQYRLPEGRQILSGASFDIPAGGVTLLVGRSGAGKTTIARLMLGFLTPTGGRIEVLGRDQGSWNHAAMLEHMSYLAQTGHVVSGTVGENLFAADEVDENGAADVLCVVGLAAGRSDGSSLLERDAGELSEGQKQRLALARILVDRSPLVVLDEPLAGVDVFTFAVARDALTRWLTDSNRSVVLVSHRLAFESLATHVVVLGDDGRVSEQGTPAELRSQGGVFAELVAAADRST